MQTLQLDSALLDDHDHTSAASSADLPSYAAWQHHDGRDGFEVVFLGRDQAGLRAEGSTAAVEGTDPFIVRYEIALDAQWRTRSALIYGRSSAGTFARRLEADGHGRWTTDGEAAPRLDRCLDVDLESSVLTNAFPLHRVGLSRAQAAEAPAAYVRALDLRVERLEQRYRRLDDVRDRRRYAYESSTFDFRCQLLYDAAGLVLDYPGIATRVR